MGKAITRAKNKYNAANYDRISLSVGKGQKEKIKAHADSMGESINGFIIRAISEAMQRDTGRELPEMQSKTKSTDSETEILKNELLKKLNGL